MIRRGLAPLAIAAAVLLHPAFVHTAYAQKSTPPAATDEIRYTLQRGDTVNVTVFGHADLSGELILDEAGTVVLPIGGAVAAAGLTAGELEERITRVLADGYIIRPSVTVRIAAMRPIYVMGDVRTAGAVPFRPGMTALSAIAMAGGLASTRQEILTLRATLRDAEERLSLMEGQRTAVRARIARLAAQRDGVEKIDFPSNIHDGRPETARLLASERAVLAAERSTEAGQLAVWMLRLKSAEAEVKSIDEQVRLERAQLAFVTNYHADLVKLQRRGLVDRRRVLEMQLEESRLTANIARLETESTRAMQMVSEAPLRLREIRAAAQQQALLALQEANARHRELDAGIDATRDKIAALQRRFAAAGGVQSSGGTGLVLTRLGSDKSGTFEIRESARLQPGDVLRVTGLSDAALSDAAVGSASPSESRRN